MEKRNMSGDYVNRFQNLLKEFDKVGLGHYELLDMYLSACHNELASCPNKESERYRLYDFLRNKKNNNDLFYDNIFAWLEEKAKERIAKFEEKILKLKDS